VALPFTLGSRRNRQRHEDALSFSSSFAAGVYPIGWPSTNSSSKARHDPRIIGELTTAAAETPGANWRSLIEHQLAADGECTDHARHNRNRTEDQCHHAHRRLPYAPASQKS